MTHTPNAAGLWYVPSDMPSQCEYLIYKSNYEFSWTSRYTTDYSPRDTTPDGFEEYCKEDDTYFSLKSKLKLPMEFLI